MRWVAAGILALAILFCVGLQARPASAGLVDFLLSDCGQAGLAPSCNNSDSGFSTLKYSAGGLDLTANGTALGLPNNFDLRLGTPDETGLGLFGATPANEIGPNDNVQLDMTDLVKAGITSGSITLSSLQQGEVGFVQFDATGQAAVEVGSTGISAPIAVTFDAANPFVNIFASAGDVLAVGDVEVSVPEVAPWMLALTGVLGIVLWRRRLV